MADKIIARWQDWSGEGVEHLVLTQNASDVIAESAIITKLDGHPMALRYRIRCDPSWQVRNVELAIIGDARRVELTRDGRGNWFDGEGIAQPQLSGAIDVDISATPFTNTLPIRRLKLARGAAAENPCRLHLAAGARSPDRSAAVHISRCRRGPLSLRIRR